MRRGGINNFAEVTHTGHYYKPSKRGCVMSSEARQFVFFRCWLFEHVKMIHRLLRKVRKSIKKKAFSPLFSFPLHATATQVEAADVSPLV